MKKFLCLTLLITLITGLCACGGSSKYKITCTSLTPPFNYQTKAGDYDGIDQAVLKEITETKELQYELLYSNNINEAVDELHAEKTDAIFGCVTANHDTENVLDFSEPYYSDGFAIVAMQSNEELNTLEDLKGKTVAVAANSNCYYYIKNKAADLGFECIIYQNAADVFGAIPAGSADAYIDVLSSVNYLIETGAPLKIVYSEDAVFEYAFAFAKGKNELLRSEINETIKKMKTDGTLDEILNKYKNIQI